MKSILVYSGKGGVGKTTTSANIAKTLAKNGKKVFVIDGDINTPSMRVIFKNAHPSENIWVASTAFTFGNTIYLEKSMVRKFLADAIREIRSVKPDYVIIDTPPSITDVHINLTEMLKISAILIVTQPNELSRADVNRTAMFFTQQFKEAGVLVVENMYTAETNFNYTWKMIERIPFVDGFDGSKALEMFEDKYQNIAREIEAMNPAEVILEVKKRMLFDESIEENHLYLDNSSPKDLKFINLKTWDAISDKLMDKQSYLGPDRQEVNELHNRKNRQIS